MSQQADIYPRILKLISSDAPLSDFGTLLKDIKTVDRRKPANRKLLDDATTALRFRELYESARAREFDLFSLHEAAQDLLRTRKVKPIYETIARHAKRLSGSDIAYVLLLDPSQFYLTVAAVDGAFDADVSNIECCRCPAPGAWPIVRDSTTNIANICNLGSSEELTKALEKDGVNSVLGIPLGGDRPTGVLCVGSRHERVYSGKERAALCSLGTLATLAIENAVAFEKLNESNLSYEERDAAHVTALEVAERINGTIDALCVVVAGGCTLEDFVEAMAKHLAGHVGLIDESARAIAGTHPSHLIGDDLIGAARMSAQSRQIVELPPYAEITTSVIAVRGDAANGHALVLSGVKPLSTFEKRVLEKSAVLAGVVLLHLERLAQTAFRDTADALTKLLREQSDFAFNEAARRMLRGHFVSWPISLILVDAPTISASRACAIAQPIIPKEEALFGPIDGLLVVVTSHVKAAILADKLLSAFAASTDPNAVSLLLSAAISDGRQLPGAYSALRKSLPLLRKFGFAGKVAHEGSLSLYALLLNNAADASAFVSRTIGPLVNHDKRKSGQLCATLEAFFDNSRSIQKTADALGVHVNTVRQRMDSISQINIDVNHPMRALDIHVALKIRAATSAPSRLD